mgnify:CR=1 FL=1
MKTDNRLQDPLPLFFHVPRGRVRYLAHGPLPLLFSVARDDVRRHLWVNQLPVLHEQAHPFGALTEVCSLAEEGARRTLAEAAVFDDIPGALEATLMLWVDFCDRVAERLHGGEELTTVLAIAWTLEDACDVELE